MTTPAGTAPGPRPRLAAALAGAAAPLLFVGVARAWWGADAPAGAALALLAGGALGAVLPASRALTAGLSAASVAAVLLVLLVVAGLTPAVAELAAVPLLALLAGGALAGRALARGRSSISPTTAALGGAALAAALRAPTAASAHAADALLAPVGLLLLALSWRVTAPAPTRPRASWRLAVAALVGAGVGLTAALSALAAAQGQARPAGAAVVVALAGGAWLGAQRPVRARTAIGWAALALSCAAGLAAAVAITRSGQGVDAAALLAALAAGVAVVPLQLARGGAGLPLWVGALAAVLVAPVPARTLAARLEEADAVALALGHAPPADADLRRAVDDGRLRLRFASPDVPAVRVIDLRANDRAARALYEGALLRGAVPLEPPATGAADRGPDRATGRSGALLAAPVLEAALPHLLAPDAPARVVMLGLDAGVSAGATLLGPAVEALTVVEPSAGVIAAHRDPGDLFGAVNGRPLDDARTRLLAGAAWPRLRALGGHPADALLAGAASPADVALARRAARVLVVRVPQDDLRARVADLLPALGPDVLAFWPNVDAPVLLVAGAGPLDPARVATRWDEAGALRGRLEALGVKHPRDVVGLCVAGPTGLAAFVAGAGGGDGPVALARAAAESLPEALALPAEPGARAALLVRLAEEAGRRAAPTAGAFARAALRAARTPETLRVLGDALLQEGRPDEARARWREALALDPAAVAPRLSMAVLHAQRGEGAAARAVLEEALEGDPAKDAPVRYALGQLAMAEGDYAKAREQYLAAGALSDAPERAVLAGELARRGARGQRERPVEQRLTTAGLLLERAEGAIAEGDEEAAGRHLASTVAILLELADDPDALTDDARALVGRLLSRAAAAEPVEPVRTHLYRRAAEVLEPLDDDPVLAVERAVALHLAGSTDEAERLLREVGAAAGARTPRVHAALGDLLASTGRGDAAIEAYERALAVGAGASSDARLYLAIAGLHRDAGRLDRAVRALEDADRLVPDHPDVLADLGALYRKQGRDGDALTAWRRFLEVAGPRHPLRARIAVEVRRLEAGR